MPAGSGRKTTSLSWSRSPSMLSESETFMAGLRVIRRGIGRIAPVRMISESSFTHFCWAEARVKSLVNRSNLPSFSVNRTTKETLPLKNIEQPFTQLRTSGSPFR